MGETHPKNTRFTDPSLSAMRIYADSDYPNVRGLRRQLNRVYWADLIATPKSIVHKKDHPSAITPMLSLTCVGYQLSKSPSVSGVEVPVFGPHFLGVFKTTAWQRKGENRICYGAESLTASTHQVVCPYLGDERSRQFKGSMIRGLYYRLSTC